MKDENRPGIARQIAGMVEGVAAPDARPAPTVADIVRAIDYLLPRPHIVHDPDLVPIDPPQYRAAWYRPAPVDPFTGGPEWDADDPEALRAAGAQAVATALAGLADLGRMAWRRDIREVSALVLEWLDADGGAYDDLLADIGFRPKRGASFVSVRKLAARDAILADLIRDRLPRCGNQSDMQVARDIRDQFEAYRANGGHAADKAVGGRQRDATRAAFFDILDLGLHYPMPSVQGIAAMVEDARAM